MLTNAELRNLLKRSEPERATERDRLDKIHRYVIGDHPGPYRPRTANAEYDLLIRRSTTNLMPMVRNASSQQLFVEGYRASPKRGVPDTLADAPGWLHWQANGMDSRHTQLITSALTYGYAWGTALPGSRGPKMRGLSARAMFCLWDNPVDDEWPRYALTTNVTTGTVTAVMDDQFRYTVGSVPGGFGPQILKAEEHGVGVCPVVRYAPDMDLDGRCTGEIEPLYDVQDRINQTAFDLLVAQTYSSFKIRGISGMTQPLDGNGNPTPVILDHQRFMLAEDADVKPWQLDGTPLDGYLKSLEASIHQFAVKSQTPPHYLLANLSNLSAEALAAAETTLTRKVAGYKHTLGESVEQHIRLASVVAKDEPVDEQDVHAQVVWADLESRSLSQVADALGKLADQLDIPSEGLWTRIPGVTQTDITDWQRLKNRQDPLERMRQDLDQGDNEGADPPPVAAVA